MPMPRKSKNVRIVKTVRIDPDDLEKIILAYGSLTAFIDAKIKSDKKIKSN